MICTIYNINEFPFNKEHVVDTSSVLHHVRGWWLSLKVPDIKLHWNKDGSMSQTQLYKLATYFYEDG